MVGINKYTHNTFKKALRPETKRPGNTRKGWQNREQKVRPRVPRTKEWHPEVPGYKEPVDSENLVPNFKKLPFNISGGKRRKTLKVSK